MADDTLKIYVWSDGTWISEEDVDDLDWYIQSNGKSDDYAVHEVPLELDAEDIEELICLEALPGMIPDTVAVTLEDVLKTGGEVQVGENDILIISHSKDIDYNAVTMLEDRLIINAPNLLIKIIKGQKV